MPATIDATGLEIPTLQEIRDDMAADIKVRLGDSWSTSPDGPVGQIIDSFALREFSVYQLIQQLYDSGSFANAAGTFLDNLSSIRGVPRLPARRSTGFLDLTGTPLTVVPALSRARIPGGATFRTTEEGTIPQTVAAESVDLGALEGLTGTVTEIVDVVAGWSGVSNAADFVLGRLEESDADYRNRSDQSIQARGTGTDQAIRAEVLELPDVIAAATISNRTESVDALGIPGHNFRVVVDPATADEDAIALAIFNTQPAGIRSDGTTLKTVTDEQGYSQEVRYSDSALIACWVTANVTPLASYPVDGDDQVEASILAFETSTIKIGVDLVAQDIECKVRLDVPGIKKVEVLVGTAPAPTGDEVTIELTEKADLDSARIVVTS